LRLRRATGDELHARPVEWVHVAFDSEALSPMGAVVLIVRG
jgi:hypothetical protein